MAYWSSLWSGLQEVALDVSQLYSRSKPEVEFSGNIKADSGSTFKMQTRNILVLICKGLKKKRLVTEINIMYLLCLVCLSFKKKFFFPGPFRSFSDRSRP